jgi:transmembrane protein TMEM260 (protein O-mannosyltransferase)
LVRAHELRFLVLADECSFERLARNACRATAGLAPLFVYLLTIAPAVQPGDSAELSTAVATLGIPHPPGYPVYVLATYPFTLLPFGDLAFRVNLASAFYGALCVLLIFELLLAMGLNPVPALVSSQFAAFSYYFWAQSLVAEIYTFDVLLLVALLRSIVGFQQDQSTWWLATVAACAGLGVANRSGFALFLPIALVALVQPYARPRPRQALIASLTLLLGLSSYLLLPLRSMDHSAYVWGGHYLIDGTSVRADLTSPLALWDYFTLRPFHWLFFAESHSGSSDRVRTAATWGWAAFLGTGTLLGVVGLTRAWRERRVEVLAIGATALTYAVALTFYGAPDRETMLLPFVVLWSIPVGLGLALLWDSSPVFKTCALLSVATMILVNFPITNRSDAYEPRTDAIRTLDSFESGSIVIGFWPEMAVMEHLQQVEGERTDLTLVHMWATGPYFAYAIADANRMSRPVYVQLYGPPSPDLQLHSISGWAVFDSVDREAGVK